MLVWLLGAALLSGTGLGAGQTPSPPAVPPADQPQPLASPAAPAVQAPEAVPTPAQPTPEQPATAQPTTEQPNERSSISLIRKGKDGKQRQIKVERTGTSDSTGIFAICTPRDDDPAGTPTLFVTSESGEGGIELMVDKNLIRAPLAVITKEDGAEGDKGGDGHIEVSAGSAKYLDNVPEGKTDRLSLCAVEATPAPAPDTVFVTQGRTHLKGKSLVYDESDGIARIEGPITFERDPAPDKPESEKLTGSSDTIEVNIDSETTTLVGNVTLKSGTRISTAERVEYDDKSNVAVLRGTSEHPAESVDGKSSTVRGLTIRYNLDTGRVSAQGVTGEFQDSE